MKTLFEKKKGELLLKIVKGENLKLRMEVSYDGDQADAGFFLELDSEEYLEILKGIIPGQVDDMLIEAIKAGLK